MWGIWRKKLISHKPVCGIKSSAPITSYPSKFSWVTWVTCLVPSIKLYLAVNPLKVVKHRCFYKNWRIAATNITFHDPNPISLLWSWKYTGKYWFTMSITFLLNSTYFVICILSTVISFDLNSQFHCRYNNRILSPFFMRLTLKIWCNT